jgi:reactive intermediate/imine deaminase
LRRVIVNTNAAPAAIGPYNQAVIVDKTMYISGCIGFIPKTMEIIGGGVEAEASQALINMGAILKAAGCTHKNVVKTTVLLNDIKDFAAVNEIYKNFFTSHYPARAAYQAAALPKGAKVEIEAIAMVGEIIDENL